MILQSFNTTLNSDPKTDAIYKHEIPTRLFKQKLQIPTDLDLRNLYNLTPIQNQKNCGSCYAFALSGMLSDRFNILSGNQLNINLTAVDMVMCALTVPGLEISLSSYHQMLSKALSETHQTDESKEHSVHACHGNSLPNASKFLYFVGTTDITCVPNSLITTTEEIPSCQQIEDKLHDLHFSGCYQSDAAQHVYRLRNIYRLDISKKDTRDYNVCSEIYKFGPIASGFHVFKDFYDFANDISKKGLIYTHSDKKSKLMGGHAIRIIGYGEDMQDGRLIKYWIIANSWGTEWGDNGYFKMERWLDDCKLENNIICGLPDLQNVRNYITETDFPLPTIKTNVHETGEELRNEFYIDPKYFYTNATIDSIKQGKLKGNLNTPLINDLLLPNLNSFIVGKEIYKQSPVDKKSSNLLLILFLIFLLVFIILLVYIFFIKTSTKHHRKHYVQNKNT